MDNSTPTNPITPPPAQTPIGSEQTAIESEPSYEKPAEAGFPQPPAAPTPPLPPVVNQPVQQPIEKPKSKNNLLMVVAIILLIMAVGAVGYFVYENLIAKPPVIASYDDCTKAKGSVIQESFPPVCVTKGGQQFTQEVSPIPTPDVTAGWKTYINQKFGFSIKYPTDYSLHDDGPNYVEQQIEKGQQVSGTQPAILDTITFSNLAKNQFSINIFPKTPDADINDVYEFSGICGTQFADKTISNQISQFGNIQYKRVQQNSPDEKIMTDICLYNSNGNLITLRSPESSTSNLLDQILSTFSFINPSPTATVTIPTSSPSATPTTGY